MTTSHNPIVAGIGHRPISLGRTVHYVLNEDDAQQINRRRTSGASILERLTRARWHEGAQAHIGNPVEPGDVFPATVVRVWSPTCVNLQVLLDGNDTYWVTSATEQQLDGQAPYQPRTWHWPPLVLDGPPASNVGNWTRLGPENPTGIVETRTIPGPAAAVEAPQPAPEVAPDPAPAPATPTVEPPPAPPAAPVPEEPEAGNAS